ncbi:hypothetical protein FB45DRAFT_1007461 [Roridomyces roridus]|uniref:Uncharacterized protein n=1 Tax=Roridomyces roridus TaxID=1738132 RepID=A0AAD7BEY3_9AGAR|nr:hypothetical protein FB45DRAFT_1007461 [Roridomyces roridus]
MSATASSATGERDNPTYKNFKTKTPVTKTKTLGPNERALNREGRAICRILSAHDWPSIMVTCRRRPDVVAEDYTDLKDPEFSTHFTPGASSSRKRTRPRKRSESPLTTSEDDSSEDESKPSTLRVPLKRKCVGDAGQSHAAVSRPLFPGHRSLSANRRHPSLARYFSSSAHSVSESLPSPPRTVPPLPRRKPRSPTKSPTSSGTSLSAFLKSVSQIDLSAHLSLLSARGFTLERIHIMSETWTDGMIKEAVERGLCEDEEGADQWRGMSAFHALTLELGIRKFRGRAGSSANSNIIPTIPVTLSAFLRNVVGFDLTAHRSLLEDQGFDIDRLRVMREWDAEDLREVLCRTLRPRGECAGGMSKLDVLAVEFALRRR